MLHNISYNFHFSLFVSVNAQITTWCHFHAPVPQCSVHLIIHYWFMKLLFTSVKKNGKEICIYTLFWIFIFASTSVLCFFMWVQIALTNHLLLGLKFFFITLQVLFTRNKFSQCSYCFLNLKMILLFDLLKISVLDMRFLVYSYIFSFWILNVPSHCPLPSIVSSEELAAIFRVLLVHNESFFSCVKHKDKFIVLEFLYNSHGTCLDVHYFVFYLTHSWLSFLDM